MFKSFFCAVALFGQSAWALEQAEKAAIQQVVQGYADAWNLRDGKGFADNYSENADFVNIFGMKFSGKAEIEERHQRILQSFLKGSKFEVVDMELKELQPGIVLAWVYWKVDGYREPGPTFSQAETREGVFSHLFVLSEKKWEIVSAQNIIMPKRKDN